MDVNVLPSILKSRAILCCGEGHMGEYVLWM